MARENIFCKGIHGKNNFAEISKNLAGYRSEHNLLTITIIM